MQNLQRSSMVGLFPAIDDIPLKFRLNGRLDQQEILINGELRKWDGPVFEVVSPIWLVNHQTGVHERYIIGSYPSATTLEADEALEAAMEAYDHGRGYWPAMSMQQRTECMESFAAGMSAKREEIVKLIIWEIGKTTADAEREFDRTMEYVNETIIATKRINNHGIKLATYRDVIAQTKKQPLGVVLCMGPSNYPLNETLIMVIPALIMGNTVLFKPPEQGGLIFSPLLEVFAACFPKGVVNTIYGPVSAIIPGLMRGGNVGALAFIGSSTVAEQLKRMHPKSTRLKTILCLDAKNPAIVLSDADLEVAVKEVILGALSQNGQRRTSLKIIFVQKDIVEAFNRLLLKELEKVVIGMPWEKGVLITPMSEPDSPQYWQEILNDARSKGGLILNAGTRGGQFFYSLVGPAVIYPVNEQMKIYHEAQFGPVIPIVPFDDLKTPLDYISQSPYGQQVSIFGEEPGIVAELIDVLAGQVGRINLNCQCQRGPDFLPFTSRKDDGEGTFSVDETLLALSVDFVIATKQTGDKESVFEKILMQDLSKKLSSDPTF